MFFFPSITSSHSFFIQKIQLLASWLVNITYFFLHCDLEKILLSCLPKCYSILETGPTEDAYSVYLFKKTDIWWVVCIASCWNVRKGLRKEIAGRSRSNTWPRKQIVHMYFSLSLWQWRSYMSLCQPTPIKSGKSNEIPISSSFDPNLLMEKTPMVSSAGFAPALWWVSRSS